MMRIVPAAALPAALLMLGLGAAPAHAVTTVIDIGVGSCPDGSCGNDEALSQTIGDSALADVSHRSLTLANAVYEPALKYWSSSYGDLTGVAWGGANATNYKAQFIFTPVAGYELSLIGFDAGCYLNRASCRTVDYTVTDGTGTAITSGSAATNHPGHASVLLNTAYSANGIILTWGPDSYDVGLDNIRFDVRAIAAPVPEPASWAMMIGGMALMGGALRRRGAALRLA